MIHNYVGGFYTIDAEQAYKVIQQLNPKIVLPMHYKLDNTISLPIKGVDRFLQFYPLVKKEKAVDITANSLPQNQEVIVLEL